MFLILQVQDVVVVVKVKDVQAEMAESGMKEEEKKEERVSERTGREVEIQEVPLEDIMMKLEESLEVSEMTGELVDERRGCFLIWEGGMILAKLHSWGQNQEKGTSSEVKVIMMTMEFEIMNEETGSRERAHKSLPHGKVQEKEKQVEEGGTRLVETAD